jgi:hypothetical protein
LNPLILDDHLVLSVLLGREPKELRPLGAEIFTTGLWYHRLCRALANKSVVGTMSRLIGNADESVGGAAVGAVIELDQTVGLISLRQLGWPMAQLLTEGYRLNLLSLEALAAAEYLGADLCLAAIDDNATLTAAATERGVSVRVM